MCRIDDRPDPVQRTVFIDEVTEWHGDVASLASYCQEQSDAMLRSSLCLGIGKTFFGTTQLEGFFALNRVVGHLYVTASDGVTHSAAGWALGDGRKTGWERSVQARSTKKPTERGPPVASQFAGHDVAQDQPRFVCAKGDLPEAKEQMVQLTRAFFLSDREISVGQFQQFISDANYPSEEQPEKWPGANAEISSSPDHPVQQVSWYDAVLFCNWLSRKERRHAVL